MPSPSISVVAPLFNEEECVPGLVRGIADALEGYSWELILVDDGSTDRTAEVAKGFAAEDDRIRVVRLARNYGQTPAMQAGFDHARGEIVVTMDGDLQNDPVDIPRLVAKLEEGYDLVAGYRVRRQDKFLTRKVPSWVANRIIRLVTGVRIRDNGCSLKAYHRRLVDRLQLYADWHRFIPAMAAATAGARIAELPVRHHPRRHGASKYGLSRVPKVVADLVTITMIRRFRERPLMMFAGAALAAMVLAAAFGAAALVSIVGFGPEKANAMVLPGAALLWLGLSSYLVMVGLIAEVALAQGQSGRDDRQPIVREVGP